jgi:UDP-glucose 4-epimerase
VRLIIDNEAKGTYFPQNDEYVDTCEVVRQVAKEAGHRIWVTRLVNPFVVLGSYIVSSINKLFGSLTYEKIVSDSFDYAYCLVDFESSITRVINA